MTDFYPDELTAQLVSPPATPLQCWNAAPLVSDHDIAPMIALVGASGGAGVSTLARMWSAAADSGTRWPANPDTTQWCVLVARLSASGVSAVGERLRDEIPAGVTVFGIVWVAASPNRTPKSVERHARTVAENVDHTWTVGWIDALISTPRAALGSADPRHELPSKKLTDLSISPPLAVCQIQREIRDVIAQWVRR